MKSKITNKDIVGYVEFKTDKQKANIKKIIAKNKLKRTIVKTPKLKPLKKIRLVIR